MEREDKIFLELTKALFNTHGIHLCNQILKENGYLEPRVFFMEVFKREWLKQSKKVEKAEHLGKTPNKLGKILQFPLNKNKQVSKSIKRR